MTFNYFEKLIMNFNIINMVCLGSINRINITVPCWLVKGIRVYYLEVRPNFMPLEGLSSMTRHVKETVKTADGEKKDIELEVQTEPFFMNSFGTREFRCRAVSEQFKDTVKVNAKDIEDAPATRRLLLKRQVASILPLEFTATKEVGKLKQVTQHVYGLIDGFQYQDVRAAVSKRQDQQKYALCVIRAMDFNRYCPHADITSNDNLHTRMQACYKRHKWGQHDVAKVCEEVINY